MYNTNYFSCTLMQNRVVKYITKLIINLFDWVYFTLYFFSCIINVRRYIIRCLVKSLIHFHVYVISLPCVF